MLNDKDANLAEDLESAKDQLAMQISKLRDGQDALQRKLDDQLQEACKVS